MQHYRQTTKALFVALATLGVLTLLLAYFTSYFSSSPDPRNILGLTRWSFGLLIASSMIGALLIIVYGTPAFMALWSRNSARWPYVLILGAAPGLLIALFFPWSYSYWIIGFGLGVAIVVRAVLGPGPNNSFKPSPHQGGA